MYMYMEIHVHSTLAKKVHREKKKGNHNSTSYKTQGFEPILDTEVPSLENWCGELESFTASQLSPHQIYMYEDMRNIKCAQCARGAQCVCMYPVRV